MGSRIQALDQPGVSAPAASVARVGQDAAKYSTMTDAIIVAAIIDQLDAMTAMALKRGFADLAVALTAVREQARDLAATLSTVVDDPQDTPTAPDED